MLKNMSTRYLFARCGLAFFAAAITLAGCVGKDRGEAPIDASDINVALEQSVDQTVISTAQSFLLEATTFKQDADDFCENTGDEKLARLQVSWRNLFEQWYPLLVFNFGPLNDNIIFPAYTFIDSLRLRGTNYLSTVRGEISEDLASSETLDDQYFISKTFQNVGLLALEAAVFETSTADHATAIDHILAEYQSQPRKCDLLTGLAGQIEHWANYVDQGWLSEFLDTGEPYRDVFLSGDLDDGSESITQLLVSVQEFLDYLQARSVVTVAAPLAGNTWQAIAAAIDVIEQLMAGTEQTTVSLFDVMVATGNQNAVDTVQGNITQIRTAIDNRDADMLEITLGFLDGNFKREIPDSLDVELGINFTDGD